MGADGNYTRIFFDSGNQYFFCKTLKNYSEILEYSGFIRTHQTHLISADKISACVKTDGGYILMNDGSRIPISRQRRDSVLQKMMI